MCNFFDRNLHCNKTYFKSWFLFLSIAAIVDLPHFFMQTQLFAEKYTVFVLQRVHVAVLFAQLQMMCAHKDDCVGRFPHLHKWLTGNLEGIVLIELQGLNVAEGWKSLLMP